MTLFLLFWSHLLALGRGAIGLCPNCATGEEVRAAVISENFLSRLGAISLPFVVLGAICYALSRSRRSVISRKDP